MASGRSKLIMPQFRFHLHGGQVLPDTEDVVLPDLQAVQLEAVRKAGTLLSDQAQEFWQDPEWALDVTDDAGLVLFTLTVLATWQLGKVEASVDA